MLGPWQINFLGKNCSLRSIPNQTSGKSGSLGSNDQLNPLEKSCSGSMKRQIVWKDSKFRHGTVIFSRHVVRHGPRGLRELRFVLLIFSRPRPNGDRDLSHRLWSFSTSFAEGCALPMAIQMQQDWSNSDYVNSDQWNCEAILMQWLHGHYMK